MTTIIIAEAGVNHNGSVKLAKQMIEEAAKAGADYIKFQTFKPEKLVSKYAQKADYQKKMTGSQESQLQMLEKLALSYDDFVELKKYCEQIGIGFLSTPFDEDSIRFLDSLDMDFWKIPSGEITNYPYLVQVAQTGRDIVLSTGMCEMDEIADAMKVLEENGAGNISLLHCNTEYPTPYEDVNLLAMNQMREVFNKQVGYSDHTVGIEMPIAAVALGAEIIEKHFTLDKNMEGPDHKASLEPLELSQMICSIRHIEKSLGDGNKKRTASEQHNVVAVRKSIVAKCEIHKGELFTEKNLTVKRPSNGISPMKWNEIIGTRAKRDFLEDELIE